METFLTFIGNLISKSAWALVVLYAFSAYGYINQYFELEPFLLYILSAALGGVSGWAVQLAWERAAILDRWLSFSLKQLCITDAQLLILAECLSDDRPMFPLPATNQVSPLIVDAIHRFLESELAYAGEGFLRFKYQYWEWLNRRRRSVLARAQVVIEADASWVDKLRSVQAPNSWMA